MRGRCGESGCGAVVGGGQGEDGGGGGHGLYGHDGLMTVGRLLQETAPPRALRLAGWLIGLNRGRAVKK